MLLSMGEMRSEPPWQVLLFRYQPDRLCERRIAAGLLGDQRLELSGCRAERSDKYLFHRFLGFRRLHRVRRIFAYSRDDLRRDLERAKQPEPRCCEHVVPGLLESRNVRHGGKTLAAPKS